MLAYILSVSGLLLIVFCSGSFPSEEQSKNQLSLGLSWTLYLMNSLNSVESTRSFLDIILKGVAFLINFWPKESFTSFLNKLSLCNSLFR